MTGINKIHTEETTEPKVKQNQMDPSRMSAKEEEEFVDFVQANVLRQHVDCCRGRSKKAMVEMFTK